jgi:hypothetical protein
MKQCYILRGYWQKWPLFLELEAASASENLVAIDILCNRI